MSGSCPDGSSELSLLTLLRARAELEEELVCGSWPGRVKKGGAQASVRNGVGACGGSVQEIQSRISLLTSRLALHVICPTSDLLPAHAMGEFTPGPPTTFFILMGTY